LSIGQTYRLSVDWDPSTNTFTFGDGVTTNQTYQPTDTPQTSKTGWKGLRAYPLVHNGSQIATDPSLWGKVSATFDNVTATGQDASGNAVTVSDNFSADKLDKTKWSSFEFVREIVGGKLVSKTRNTNTALSYQQNYLTFKNPSQVNEIKAKVAVQEYQKTNEIYDGARLAGYFYNDTGEPYNGYVGNVWAEISLVSNPGRPLEVRWAAIRMNDPVNTAIYTALAYGVLPVTVNLGQEYNLSIKWDGAQLTFGCDDYGVSYTPTTAIFPPYNNHKSLTTRVVTPITPPMDFDGYISATFDDVQVKQSVPSSPSADLAVTKTASLASVVIGQNITYTITVTNNGPNTAAGITATDTLPAGLSVVSIPYGCTQAGSTISCTAGSLANGATATFIIVVAPATSNAITNTVTVASTTPDPNMANNTSSVTTPGDTTPPTLQVTSHSHGQHVSASPITVSGTATDSGKGGNGIQQVTVNGVRAANDTASGNGTANWSRSVALSPGANTITVVAYDNSTAHNSTTNTFTVYYDVTRPPSVATGLATKVDKNKATLTGLVNPNGLATTYYFEWGPTTAYENVTAAQSAGSGWDTISVTADLTGLIHRMRYHYRLVGVNSAGTTYGEDRSFIAQPTAMPWLMLLLGE
jgi:uncharacterized repeat protein (TIGR01451 family)